MKSTHGPTVGSTIELPEKGNIFDPILEEAARRKKRRVTDGQGPVPPGRLTRQSEAPDQLVDSCECGGCGEDLKTIVMLERHIPVCSQKDKLVVRRAYFPQKRLWRHFDIWWLFNSKIQGIL